MNRKSLAISSSLIALTLAVPPPINMFMGITMFLGLKLYKTAVIFFGATLIIYSGPLIGLVNNNQFIRVMEAQDVIAHDIAEATLTDPSLFPYTIVGIITAILLEIVMIGFLISPIYFIRKKVYPRIKNHL